ncbi:MAG: DUF2782 domain-containing protein [Burkholderiales bacterium]|nr:DUF2782 domain-containing protein [Burkholderiales bacterium]
MVRRPALALCASVAITTWLVAASGLALAQSPPTTAPLPPPLTTQPADAAPPAPATAAPGASDADLEPQVTITRRGSDTVEEVRMGGRISYLKVTPRIGRPYYLVPSNSGTQFLRYDSLDFGVRPPMWQLFSW